MKNNQINVLSLFSGIGAFEKALSHLFFDNYNVVNYCEIDKYASKSYSAVHGIPEELNLWDVKSVDTSKITTPIDLITYGFPCQDISLAGYQQGFFAENGEITRSGLFFEALRIIKDLQPKIAIAENVKALCGKKFKKEFDLVLSSLEEAGYNNYYQILNAKDYGIPQNRERVFVISIRKDIDDGKFKFPKPIPLKINLSDLLEKTVDEKYYLDDKFLLELEEKLEGKELSKTIRAGGRASIDRHSWDLSLIGKKIRRRTPLECWRLMGFDDKDYYKATEVCSETQLYKQAGNSIVVNVLYHLFSCLVPYLTT